MFDPERAPARFVSVAESDGIEDLLVYRVRYVGVSRLAGIVDHHLIFVNVGPPVPADCNIGRANLNHVAMPGNVTVIPSDTTWNAAMGDRSEAVVVAIPKTRLAVVAAATLNEIPVVEPQLSGQDAELLSIIKEMTISDLPHTMDGSGWHALADELINHFSTRFVTNDQSPGRGTLPPGVVARINGFLQAHLEESISIDELADVAGQTRSHFPRLFRRTIGMSPHQYVMRLRLRRAKTLIAHGCALARAAAEAGFSDQSHLTNWLRRIYGTTPGRLSPLR
jgi:AraC family transcriptional regulator